MRRVSLCYSIWRTRPFSESGTRVTPIALWNCREGGESPWRAPWGARPPPGGTGAKGSWVGRAMTGLEKVLVLAWCCRCAAAELPSTILVPCSRRPLAVGPNAVRGFGTNDDDGAPAVGPVGGSAAKLIATGPRRNSLG